MKICLINNLYKPFRRGGADRIVDLTRQALEGDGHQVFVISTKTRKQTVAEEDRINSYFLSTSYQNLAKIPLLVRFFWHVWNMFDFVTAKRVQTILKKEKPDLVITHNLKGVSFLIPRVVKKMKIRHIHVLHDMQLVHPLGLMFFGREKEVNSMPAKIYAGVNRWLFKKVDVVISPSQWLLNEHKQRGFFAQSKQAVLPNPVSMRAQTEKKQNTQFTITYIGEMSYHKGVETLIKAFNQINSKSFKLVLMGSGPLLEEYRNKNKNQNIEYLGWTDYAKGIKIIQDSDCLVLPSICYENSPTALYDAISVGTPIIASNIGGCIEIVNTYDGALFTPGDTNDLVKKILWVKENHDKLIQKRGENIKRIGELRMENYTKKILSL